MNKFSPLPCIGKTYLAEDKQSYVVKDIIQKGDADIVVTESNELVLVLNAETWNLLGLKEADNDQQDNTHNHSQSDSQLVLSQEHRKYMHMREGYLRSVEMIQEKREKGRTLKWKVGIWNELMWSIAGVDKDLLRSCPSDYNHYAGYGGTILTNSILVAFSFGNLFYYMNVPIMLCIVFGCIFGVLILLMEQYFLVSPCTDGLLKISKKDLISALPRILIALMLGFVCAKSIELSVFSNVIKDNLIQEEIQKTDYTSRINDLEKMREFNSNAIFRLIEENQKLAEKLGYEITDSPRHGPREKRIELVIENNIGQIDSLQTINKLIIAERSKLNSAIQSFTSYSLLQKIESLYVVTAFQNKTKEGHSNISFWIRLSIDIMFMFLFVIPILSKLMSITSKYESLLCLEDASVKQLIDISTQLNKVHETSKSII